MAQVDYERLERLGRELLEAIGEDPQREGLRNTPARFARWWQAFIEHEAGNCDTTFESVQADQLVVLRDIRIWSLCEHHTLPFWCDVSIGYLSEARILGISKLARIAQRHAHQLQVQERLVQQIAVAVGEAAQTPHVAVVARGYHLCMAMRGVKSDARMISSEMRGQFRTEAALRSEFLRLAGF